MNRINFETPESVEISYQVAGLGTRFMAWVIDSIIVVILTVVMLFALLIAGVVGDSFLDSFGPSERRRSHEGMAYAIGFLAIVFSLGSIVYFMLAELLGHGATPGKRVMGIRVAKIDGFSVSPSGIIVRNIMRVVDNSIPLLWIVMLVSPRSQRLGDIVSGSVVVVDQTKYLDEQRELLSTGTAQGEKFRFDGTALALARPTDVEAVEKLLARWNSMPAQQRETIVSQIVDPLARRLKMEAPPLEDRLIFLQDFLAAHRLRQHRRLG